MASARLWTLERFERELRVLLLSERTRLIEADLWDRAADITWEGDGSRGARIRFDPYQRGIVWMVLHELTHFLLRELVESNRLGELEEGAIEGMATDLCRRVESSKRRFAWWRNAIRSKLA